MLLYSMKGKTFFKYVHPQQLILEDHSGRIKEKGNHRAHEI